MGGGTHYLSSTVKLEANMLAVILWQSEQLQMNVVTRPGPWTGCCVLDGRENYEKGRGVFGAGLEDVRRLVGRRRRSRLRLLLRRWTSRLVLGLRVGSGIWICRLGLWGTLLFCLVE